MNVPTTKTTAATMGRGRRSAGTTGGSGPASRCPPGGAAPSVAILHPPHPSPTNEMLTLPILVGGSGINVSDLCHCPVSFRQSIEIDSAAALPQVRETNSESMMQCAEEVEQSCWQKSKKGIGCQAWCKSIFVLGMNALIQNN